MHPDLVRVVEPAIQITTQDFRVQEGLRTRERRRRPLFNGPYRRVPVSQVQRSDGWIETTWNNMSDPGAFDVAGAEEQEGGEPPPLTGAGRLPHGMRAIVWCGPALNEARVPS